MAYESLTTSQLETLRDALLAAATGAAPASGIKNYTVPGLSVQRLSPMEALEALKDVDAALTARSDKVGGQINVYFDEPE